MKKSNLILLITALVFLCAVIGTNLILKYRYDHGKISTDEYLPTFAYSPLRPPFIDISEVGYVELIPSDTFRLTYLKPEATVPEGGAEREISIKPENRDSGDMVVQPKMKLDTVIRISSSIPGKKVPQLIIYGASNAKPRVILHNTFVMLYGDDKGDGPDYELDAEGVTLFIGQDFDMPLSDSVPIKIHSLKVLGSAAFNLSKCIHIHKLILQGHNEYGPLDPAKIDSIIRIP